MAAQIIKPDSTTGALPGTHPRFWQMAFTAAQAVLQTIAVLIKGANTADLARA